MLWTDADGVNKLYRIGLARCNRKLYSLVLSCTHSCKTKVGEIQLFAVLRIGYDSQYVKKHLLCLIENVGANIVRPPTWRSNALFGKLLTGRTGTGEQCSPLQCAFLTVWASPAGEGFFHFSKYACTLFSASRPSRWPRLYRSSSLFSSPSNRPIVIGSCGRTQQMRPSASSSSS